MFAFWLSNTTVVIRITGKAVYPAEAASDLPKFVFEGEQLLGACRDR